MVTSDGPIKKNAAWIIVNAIDNKIVAAVPLTEPPPTEASSPSEQAKEVYPTDPVRGTADFLSRTQSATIDPALYTEKLVDEKIAELLRKNPEATYMAFRHVKSGKLPILPVQWISV